MKRFAGWAARAAAVVLVAGLLVRVLGVRDRVQALAVIFYATPWPVLAALAFVLAAYAIGRRRRCRALGLALVMAACATMWVRHSFIDTSPAAARETLRLVYWNASRPVYRLPQRVEYLRSLGADVIAVGESNIYTNEIPADWRTAFPGRVFTQRRAGMLLITPEEPVTVETGRLGERGDYVLARCMVKGHAMTLLLVDFEARPTQSRAEPFARLAELITAHRDEPLVVVGDFNTPRESVFFDPLCTDFQHAFESAGRGFAETWPTLAPVLSLDHVWLGARWRAVGCALGTSLQSDHRAVIVDLVRR
jgi:endonuclease/exonuclease/phosphatase (EEP) superfamily protein YafD